MLDLKRLVIFAEVARQRSFSDAARVLSYSQPAVSHHVSRLEHELGVRLFERSSRGNVELTEAGLVLLRHTDTLLTAAANAEAEVAEFVGERETHLRVCAFATAMATILTDAIASLRVASSGVQIALREAESPESIAGLKARRLDLALVFDNERHPLAAEDDLEYRYLYDDPLLVALPRGHHLACAPVVQFADLAGEQWIEGAGATTPCSLILSAACQDVGFEPDVVLSSGNYQVVQRLTATGAGVALIPELALTNPDPGIVLRRLQPQPWRRIALGRHRTAFRSATVRAMASVIEQTCQRYAEGRDARVDVVVAA